jgi:hypothetical protein
VFRFNNAITDVNRIQRDLRSMQQISTHREMRINHVPQASRAGISQRDDKRPGGGPKRAEAAGLTHGPQNVR